MPGKRETRTERVRPAVFRQPGSMLYADNCRALQEAAARGETRLVAWTRGSYPGRPLDGRLPGVCTIGFWDARSPQRWGLARHCNEGIKFAYLARGTLSLEVDGVTHQLSAGDVFIIRPWQLHAIGTPHVDANQLVWMLLDVNMRRPTDRWRWPRWLLWSDADVQRLHDYLALNDRSVLRASPALAQAFLGIRAVLERQTPENGEARMMVAGNAMLLALLDALDAAPPPLDADAATTRRTVDLFLSRLPLALEQPWRLEDMARECGLSRTRFAHYCRLITNATPAQHLRRLRLNKAALLIREDQARSVTEIAFACGFGSSQHFSTAYRAEFGVPPRQGRRSAASRREGSEALAGAGD
ncbi:AraC family transcriptional regulator [Elioraea sp.]|uniref:AraC family transcriptional regulator n=1 Tax=Elioraea sp. TaxID=2185103 RepID=UPI0025BA4B15|nr:AraC family transcriptional regulator [Elioraea sp.]